MDSRLLLPSCRLLRRRAPRHRRRRERMAQAGVLVQLDGSEHHWLGRGVPPARCWPRSMMRRGPWWARCSGRGGCGGVSGVAAGTGAERGLSAGGLPRQTRHLVRPARERESLAEQLGGTAGSDASRTGVAATGDWLHPRPLAAGQGAGGAALRYAARPLGGGAAPRRDHHAGRPANAFLPGFLARFNARFAVPATEAEVGLSGAPGRVRSLGDLLLRYAAPPIIHLPPPRPRPITLSPYHPITHSAIDSASPTAYATKAF